MSKTSKLIAVHDMPKMKHDGKTISDPVGILEILKGVKSITLEEVGSRPPRQSGVFTFGMSQGIVVACARILDIPIQMVRPRTGKDSSGSRPARKTLKRRKRRSPPRP